jgi:hypothetical protein
MCASMISVNLIMEEKLLVECDEIDPLSDKRLRQWIQKSGLDKATCDPQEVRTVDPLLATVCVGVMGGAELRHVREKKIYECLQKKYRNEHFVTRFFLPN